MTQDTQPDIWKLRLNATLAAIEGLKADLDLGEPKRVGKASGGKKPSERKPKQLRFELDDRTRTIALLLLSNLEQFIEPHFDFFYKKLVNKEPIPPGARNESALNAILIQAGADLAAITQAVAQRAIRVNGKIDPARKRLEFADYLVESSLQKVKHLFPVKRYLQGNSVSPGADEAPVALTYFHKSPVIRVIPYANVALIGIPYSSLKVNIDLFAIPHELGHYVYWNGRGQQSAGKLEYIPFYFALKSTLTKTAPKERLPKWLVEWGEEIFADVFGAAVAGYVMALDFQDLMLATDSFGAALDDGEHPAPILRPNIYQDILEALPYTGAAKTVIALLGKRWDSKKKAVFKDINTLSPILLSDVAIDKSVEELLGIGTQKVFDLLGVKSGSNPLADIWTLPDEDLKKLVDPNALEELYTLWEKNVPKGGKGDKPNTNTQLNWDALKAEWMREAEAAGEFEPGEREWRSVNLAGGWTEGPTGPRPPGPNAPPPPPTT